MDELIYSYLYEFQNSEALETYTLMIAMTACLEFGLYLRHHKIYSHNLNGLENL